VTEKKITEKQKKKMPIDINHTREAIRHSHQTAGQAEGEQKEGKGRRRGRQV
jgi:hypothetical protein